VTESGQVPDHAAIAGYVDAATPGLAPADFIIVFGTRFPDPAPVAASLYHDGLSPRIVLTGGANRQLPDLIEADVHADLIKAADVPPDAIIIERQSRNTFENVTFARQLIQPVIGHPETAIAVVKWHHRRAVLLLARNIPSLRRIFTVTYNPPGPGTGEPVTRDNWPGQDASGVRREFDAIHSLLKQGQVDELAASGYGWTRLRPGRR
jgi:uncharacterized SAM-binding protein YcdF (DUF218 family)